MMIADPARNDTTPFQLVRSATTGWLRRLGYSGIETISGLTELDRLYRGHDWPRQPRAFCEQVLRLMRVSYNASAMDLDQIPRTGPAIVVANHPFGGIDGIIAAHLLTGVRSDVRVMVNYHLCRIEELRQLFIPVDPYGSEHSRRHNSQPLREALRWVRSGGILLVFPAGDVARLCLKQRSVREAPWNPMIGRLVRMTEASVIPVCFHGHNGWLFQALGLLHARIRTLLLPRELLNKAGTTIHLRIGRAIRYTRLRRLDSDEKITRYLKMHTTLLARQPQPASHNQSAARAYSSGAEVIAATPVDLLQAEVANLEPAQCLLEQGDMQVYLARAGQIPWLLQEIGRLRELTFRAVGEGTGKAIDMDLYDTYYQHLFIWQRARHEVVGAYRLAQSDEVIGRYGLKGLYTHSLFRYSMKLLDQINPSIELGRSFIRPEYQRNHTPLLLVWRGISSYLVRHPRYRYLFGPVTISGDYDQNSLRLLIGCLRLNNGYSGIRVRPRTPLPNQRLPFLPDEDLRCVTDIDLVSDLIAQIESDQKGVPVLIKQYLKMGGKFLEFNLDEDFNNAVDGLIVVDMKQTDLRLLQQYMGKTGAESYLRNTTPAIPRFDEAS